MRPKKRKAVRKQQTIVIWILVFVFLSGVMFYSGIKVYLDTKNPMGAVSLAAAGLIGISLVLFKFRKELKTAKELERNGITTFGKVIDKRVSVGRHGEGNTDRYFVLYQFKNDYVAEQRVNSNFYEALEVGSMVTIRYLPNDPHCSRMDVPS